MFHETQVYIEQLYLYVNFYTCVFVCVCVCIQRKRRERREEKEEDILNNFIDMKFKKKRCF